MWFKNRAWIPTAWILSLINLGAVWFAARPGEPWHATAHALLAVALAVGAMRLQTRSAIGAQADVQELLDENEQLQQLVDDKEARMLELKERLDFTERLLTQEREPRQPAPPPDTRG